MTTTGTPAYRAEDGSYYGRPALQGGRWFADRYDANGGASIVFDYAIPAECFAHYRIDPRPTAR